MSKCSKVKNPCKICLGPVTLKNGLQCKGACKTWMHFECLNYTPGKIKDIKAGIIKVTCPCPDCKTTEPKEFRTDTPFSCTNIKCPANRPAKCENKECPSNKNAEKEKSQDKCGDKINQTSTNMIPPGPLTKCGVDCKRSSLPQLPSAQGATGKSCDPRSSSVSMKTSPSTDDPSGDALKNPRADLSSLGTLQQMCKTVGQLANQINHLMSKMKQAVSEPEGSCMKKDKNKSCPPSGNNQKPNCPKPCHCPGNPNRKK